MPAPQKFNTFTLDLLSGIHDFTTHTFKLMLSNTAPVNTNAVKADIIEIAAGFGYSAGGATATCAAVLTGGVAKVTIVDISFAAAGGAIGPFRYGVLYNDTSAGDRLIGRIDVGSNITIPDGSSHLFDFDVALGVITLG